MNVLKQNMYKNITFSLQMISVLFTNKELENNIIHNNKKECNISTDIYFVIVN